MSLFSFRGIISYFALLIVPSVLAQHSHFVAGAESPVQGAKLIAVNGNDFLHISRYVRNLSFSTSGTYANYYSASCPFVVAAATPPFGGPEANAPALGSFIEMDFISLHGPAGGGLGYWEAGQTGSATFSLEVGTTNGTNRIALSDANLGAGQPGADPYGHVHGRRFSASVPGFYTLGYRFIDTSRNGVNAGPIHTPSEIYYLYLQAEITIPFVTVQSNSVEIAYGAAVGRNYYVEHTPSLGSSVNWAEVGGPFIGDDRLQTFRYASPGFFRIKAVVP